MWEKLRVSGNKSHKVTCNAFLKSKAQHFIIPWLCLCRQRPTLRTAMREGGKKQRHNSLQQSTAFTPDSNSSPPLTIHHRSAPSVLVSLTTFPLVLTVIKRVLHSLNSPPPSPTPSDVLGFKAEALGERNKRITFPSSHWIWEAFWPAEICLNISIKSHPRRVKTYLPLGGAGRGGGRHNRLVLSVLLPWECHFNFLFLIRRAVEGLSPCFGAV